MIDLGNDLLRRLAAWETAGAPVTSLYLTVDGRRYPRKADYEVRLDEQLRAARAAANGADRAAARSVECDVGAMSAYVRDEFERGDTRGLALFSSHAAGLWQEVRIPRPVRDRVVVAPQADVLPLKQVLDTYDPMCVALLDYQRTRLFVLELGRIREVDDFQDEVPNRHEQGGRSQMRRQRHVDDHRTQHVKRAAEALLALDRRRRFDHLVLAGPAEAHVELEKLLHEYLRPRVRATLSVPITATPEDVRRMAVEIEERLEREAEEAKATQLLEAAATGSRGVTGLPGTLAALGEHRVGELVVALDRHAPGAACPSCGRLSDRAGRCPVCSGEMTPVADVVEAAVAAAVRDGSRVETVLDPALLSPADGVGALLRF